ncbi:MAG: hypothetical protein K2F82_05730 [Muribaculaceae bacterium]|nr:hypothetical protein [Muribaculaceae bacterium]
MKKFLIAAAGTLMLTATLSSCNEYHYDETTYYYVRYSVTGHPDQTYKIYYTTENDESQLIQRTSADGQYSFVVGPVQKGFTAHLTASNSDLGGAPKNMSIEVCRRSEPFVIKANTSRAFSLEYTIKE